jgi:cytochrome b6-f complex iron-sulfur subunit
MEMAVGAMSGAGAHGDPAPRDSASRVSAARDSTHDRGRRRFLFGAIGAIAAGIVAEVAGIVLAYVAPDRGGAGARVSCGRAEDYKPGEVRLIPEVHLYVIRRDEGFLALSQRCTHLGCLVPWDEERRAFHCPCHGGGFDEKGLVTAGPPPRPLDVVALEIDNGELIADTGNTKTRRGWSDEHVVKA